MALAKRKLSISQSREFDPNQSNFANDLDSSLKNESFSCSAVEETDNAYLLIGETEIYKVYKQITYQQRDMRSFANRWLTACEEYLDHSISASGLYLGLKTFRWIEGKIVWLQNQPITEINHKNIPELADDVCLILKRVPIEQSLDQIHAQQGFLSERQLKTLARSLFLFHQAQIAKEKQRKRYDYDIVAANIVDDLEQDLASLKLHAKRHANRLQVVIIDEVRALIQKHFEAVLHILFVRAERQLLTDTLGGTSLQNCLATRFTGNAQILFKDRIPRYLRQRRNDVLVDLISLVLDFEERGDKVAAHAIEQYYFELFPESYCPELKLFFLVKESVRRASICASDTQASLLHLSQALRKLIGYNTQSLVLVGGEDTEDKHALASNLAAILDAKLVGAEEYRAALADGRLAEIIAQGQNAKPNVIISAPLERRFERVQIYRAAESLQLPYCFIRCEYGRHEFAALKVLSVEQRDDRPSNAPHERNLRWDQQVMGKRFGVVLVEPSISIPLLALSLLYNLKEQSVRNSTFLTRNVDYSKEDDLTGGLKDIIDTLEECNIRAVALYDPLKARASN